MARLRYILVVLVGDAMSIPRGEASLEMRVKRAPDGAARLVVEVAGAGGDIQVAPLEEPGPAAPERARTGT
ncbi:MAG: hypothetical protein IT372_36660 [Polyangiaceae bacterium]|nr:hypothetical protein [Polyangiaceae bacterium]